jgi:hypothetical protein
MIQIHLCNCLRYSRENVIGCDHTAAVFHAQRCDARVQETALAAAETTEEHDVVTRHANIFQRSLNGKLVDANSKRFRFSSRLLLSLSTRDRGCKGSVLNTQSFE